MTGKIVQTSLAIVTACLLAMPSSAATFVFDGSVTETSTGSPSATFPPVGQAASITLTLSGEDSLLLPASQGSQSIFSVALSVPGFVSAGVFDFIEELFLSPTGFTIGTPEGAPDFDETFFADVFTTSTSIGVTFGSPVSTAPATIGDLIAALTMPGASARYSISGSGPQGGPATLVAEGTVAPIPLPAGAPILLSALAAFGLVRLRRSSRIG